MLKNDKSNIRKTFMAKFVENEIIETDSNDTSMGNTKNTLTNNKNSSSPNLETSNKKCPYINESKMDFIKTDNKPEKETAESDSDSEQKTLEGGCPVMKKGNYIKLVN